MTALQLSVILLLALPCVLPSALASTPVDRAQEVLNEWRQSDCLLDPAPDGSSHGLEATIRNAHIDKAWFAYINGSGNEVSWVDHIEVNGVAVTSDPFSDWTPPPPGEPTHWDSTPNYVENTTKGMSQRVTFYIKYFAFGDDANVQDATLELCAGTPWNEYVLYGHEDPRPGEPMAAQQTPIGASEVTLSQVFSDVATSLVRPLGSGL